ncbi:MAG: transposase [Phycisphaerales bacterium]|nr:transposase [Phycisphaerales bacterium]
MKIMVLVDARGLPVAIDTAPADAHESRCVQALFDFVLTRETPPRVIGDKAYDSDKLDEELAQRGMEMIAPHRGNRKPENVTQDRPAAAARQAAAGRWSGRSPGSRTTVGSASVGRSRAACSAASCI